MIRTILNQEQWERIAPELPGKVGDPGATAADNRLFVEAVLWIARTGAPWRDLPLEFGKWYSIYTRFWRWAQKGVWERAFKALSDDPDFEYVLIDATYAGLISSPPEAPLVIPALNRDGDCLSDLVMPMFGSIAGAESVLLAFDDEFETQVAMSEAPHGTAPALQGKDVANPMAMILACGAVMHYAGVRGYAGANRAARAIYESVLEASAAGVRTPDLGGHATTSGFTSEVVARVRTKIDVWSSMGTSV